MRYGITSLGHAHTERTPQAAGAAVQGDELALGVAGDDTHLVVAVRPAEELDAAVELVAPEERHRRVRRRRLACQLGQQVSAAACALLGRVGPVLDAHLLAGLTEQRVDPASADRRRRRSRRPRRRVDVADDAVAELEPAAVEPSRHWGDTDADHDHVGLDQLAVAEAHAGHSIAVAFDGTDGYAAAHVDAVGGHGPGRRRRPSRRRGRGSAGRSTFEHDDRAPGLGGGRGDLETDETGADHDDPRLASADRPRRASESSMRAQHRDAVETASWPGRRRGALPVAMITPSPSGTDVPSARVTARAVARRGRWR